MISVDYVRLMARYNKWQNEAVIAAAETLDDAALRLDRGAFFGSILGTLNHLLWADRIWMARLGPYDRPEITLAESPTYCPTFAAWKADRLRTDGGIDLWAKRLRPINLRGDLRYHSGAAGREFTRPVATCVAHMFNHQAHHRGQVHAMLTAAGATPAATDLTFMPGNI
ncbi:DinB family protein [Tropicimonas sp. IMCC6043]|uniref:DinB family protein n=1 Tax=Tropicimonas sp. IMCC6043 TaxID=2510645 RepID=UPI00101DF55C|nr:DinB family protein [Tropicimonas sp. IMCC6043]RYH10280.1 damage-inducible protein DinB [Tropicimonas sp. IMCC6043]